MGSTMNREVLNLTHNIFRKLAEQNIEIDDINYIDVAYKFKSTQELIVIPVAVIRKKDNTMVIARICTNRLPCIFSIDNQCKIIHTLDGKMMRINDIDSYKFLVTEPSRALEIKFLHPEENKLSRS